MNDKDRHILIVEDNPDDEELVLRALRKSKIAGRFVVVHDGVEALEYLSGTGGHKERDPRDEPLLILLDLKMPRMGGIEFLRRVRADDRTRHLPVVIFTSSGEETDISASYYAGASSYVRKPVDWTEFAETVQRLGEYWLGINRPPPTRRRTGL